MARFELKLPKMGESVAEATITNWLKEVGDKIEADEAVLEIATDKVDSEVPSEVSGILVEQLFGKDDLVQVGQTIAIIDPNKLIDCDTQIIVEKQASGATPEATRSQTYDDGKEALGLTPSMSELRRYQDDESSYQLFYHYILCQFGVLSKQVTPSILCRRRKHCDNHCKQIKY